MRPRYALLMILAVFLVLAAKPVKECPPCDPCNPGGDTVAVVTETLHASTGDTLAALQLDSGTYRVVVILSERIGTIGGKPGAYLRNGPTIFPVLVTGQWDSHATATTTILDSVTVDGAFPLQVIATDIPGGASGYNYQAWLAATAK